MVDVIFVGKKTLEWWCVYTIYILWDYTFHLHDQEN